MTAPAVETLTSVEGPEQELAAARSRAYALFVEALTYPDDELRETLTDGGLAQPLRECLTAISTEITNSPECWRALQEVGDTDDLAIEFTHLVSVYRLIRSKRNRNDAFLVKSPSDHTGN